MEACNCIWFESAAERCIVKQGPAAAAVAWCFLEVFPLCVVHCSSTTRFPAHWCGANCHGGNDFTGLLTDITLSVDTKAFVQFAVNIWWCVGEHPAVLTHVFIWGRRCLRTPCLESSSKTLTTGTGVDWVTL